MLSKTNFNAKILDKNLRTLKSWLIVLAAILMVVPAVCLSQPGVDIQFDQITSRQVRTLLKKENILELKDVDRLKTSCFDKITGLEYRYHIYSCGINERPEIVWNAYKNLNPKQLGLGDIVSFGLAYSGKHKALIYPSDTCGSVEEGQIIFSELKFLGGVVKMAVAQEITEINETEKSITFCYMENGKTNGSQKIRLRASGNGNTEVIHETFYKSKSRFRDRWLYPGLHKKAVAELHENVRRQIAQSR